MSGNSVSNVNFIDSQGVKSQMSIEEAQRLEKQNVLIFDANTNTYKVNTDTKGIKLQRENENRIQTTRTTSFNSANLTTEEKKYLQEQGLIKSFSDNGCELGLPNNASDDDIQARMGKIKTALQTYNVANPTEPTRTEKTFSQEELAKVPEDQRELLSGKITEETTGKKYDFEVTTTETTTEKYDGIPTKEELAEADLNDRSTRKAFEKRYKAGLEQWLGADPKHEEDMKLSIAGEKYSKQINKELNKLQKEYKTDKPEALVKRFFEDESSNEVPKEQKDNYKAFYGIANDVLNFDDKKLAELRQNIQLEGNTEENKKKKDEAKVLLSVHAQLKNYLASNNEDLDEIKTDPEMRANTIRAFFAETVGQDTLEAVLYKTAVDRVMDGRSAEQKVQDREDFLKYMSKRETQKVRDKQNVDNTQLYLSKEEAKAAEKAWKKAGKPNPKAQFNYVGKAGLQMIENRPDYFCKPLDNPPANPVKGKDYDYMVDGKYYKFDSKFYSDRIGKYFDNDGENYHATLAEVRNFAGENGKRIFKDKDGNKATYEQAFGNGNGIVGYKEGKRFRKSVDATGRSTDKDHTNSIRAGYIAGQSLIAGATSFATAGLAAYAGGVISGIAQGAAQTFTAPGQYVHVDGETKWVKSVVTVNGRNYTVNTPVTIDSKDVQGAEQTFNKDGQKVRYNDKVDPFGVALPAFAIGTVLSLPSNIKKSYAKRDTGHTDDVVDLYVKPKTITKTRPDSFDFSHTTYKRTLVNAGDGNLQSLYEGENDVDAKLLKDLGQINNPKARLVDTKLFERNETDVSMSDETQVKNVDELRAQATISYRKDHKTAVHVEPKVVNGVRNFDQPRQITIEDETNDKRHTWTLVYRDRKETIEKYAKQAKKLAQTNENQAFYERTGIVANGRSIVDPDNHVEIYSMGVKATPKKVPVATPLGTLYVEVITYEYNGEQNENHIGVGANHTGIANKNAKSKLIRNSRQY